MIRAAVLGAAQGLVTGLLLALALPGAATAQQTTSTTPPTTTSSQVLGVSDTVTPVADTSATPTPVTAPTVVSALQPDYAEWGRVATRAEKAAEAGIASTFALERLRSELAGWRDKFLAAQAINAPRIATVEGQIAALGPAPEASVNEPLLITARRIILADELQRLKLPSQLATEAYAQANGLVGEIDGLMRERQTQKLTTRGASPLEPDNWAMTMSALGAGLSSVAAEARAAVMTDMGTGELAQNLPRALVLLAIGIVLIWRGRRWMSELLAMVAARPSAGQGVWVFLMAAGQAALPYAGVLFVAAALSASGLAGYRGSSLVGALPAAAAFVYVGRWLGFHFFPEDPAAGGPMDLTQAARRRGLRIVAGLSWTLAGATMLITLAAQGDNAATVTAVVSLPIDIVIGIFLFRLGRLMADPAAPATETSRQRYRQRLVMVLGRVFMAVAVVGPALSALSYGAAAQALLGPSIMSLAVLGATMMLQGFVTDLYGLVTRAPEDRADALVPVLIGLVLIFVSLPFLALIWGARVTDLTEIWTRINEGLTLGSARISPVDFLRFLVIFVLGFTLTRLLQGTLRNSVLPKTTIDIGGQNAIVAGLGYLGIFLAALAAITGAGIDLSSVAIVAGALSVGIGFGLQNIVSNFVSGIILLIERPISEGDWIEVNGKSGYVRSISVRSTRIETFDRSDVIVPNADLISGQVTNWTKSNTTGRVIVTVGVAYGTDTRKVEAILEEIGNAHPMALANPGAFVNFVGFGASSLDFELRVILRDVNWSLVVKTEINHQIAQRFAAEGIEIPFAQHDIWLRNPETLRPAGPPAPPDTTTDSEGSS
ncbi:MAG: DUF3772 domain-containing protein [Limimaricola sp.]|uniref:DUF3772 domain-containing protein n=1 Tax=Limimaricola sp. TaxID=2211665 RepID=UPI001D8BDEBA|nr:DUF3772 domain-containing protein [Limimaricola sp.]MBI1416862.1 DUF3772 domain-containing protein [Limimaricola sp.]